MKRAMSAIAGAALVAGCATSGGASNADPNVEVTYRVAGSADSAFVTFWTPSGDRGETRRLPADERFTFARQGGGIYVTVVSDGTGNVRCAIEVDDETVARNQVASPDGVAECQTELPGG